MIELEELRQKIRTMTRQTGLYRVLRDELTALGYWRKLKRGNPTKGYQNMKARLSPTSMASAQHGLSEAGKGKVSNADIDNQGSEEVNDGCKQKRVESIGNQEGTARQKSK